MTSKHQRGVVLLFCLVFLALLTMTATVSMESAIVEQRAAGRMQEYQVALQAAEAALQIAGDWLAAREAMPQGGAESATMIWSPAVLDPEVTDDLPWWQDASRQQSWWQQHGTAALQMHGLAEPPRYIIEELAISEESITYRITARGSGRGESSAAMLHSIHVVHDKEPIEEPSP